MDKVVTKIILLLFSLGLAFCVRAQTNTVDSLFNKWHEVERGDVVLADSSKAKLLFNLGEEIMYHYPDSALVYYKMALVLAQNNQLHKLYGDLLNKIGYVDYILGNYDLSLTYFVKANEIHQQLENDEGIAVSLNHISLIYDTQANYQKALEYQWKSIGYSKRTNSVNRLISNYFNLSIVHDAMKSYDSAIHYLNQSMALSTANENHHLFVMAMNRMGEVFLHKGDYLEAERCYRKVLGYQGYQDKWENCFAYAGLAQTYQALEQFDESIKYGLISLEIATQMKSKWEISHGAGILYESFKRMHNFEQALAMHELFKQYSDSLFNESKEKEINFLHLKQNELERTQLAKENAFQKTVIQQNYQWFVFFIVLGGVLIGWGIILYRNNRVKLLLNKKLIRKNESIASRNAMIEEQNEKLNTLNETKNQILSIIGHDMKGPISNIKSILEIIKMGNMTGEEQRMVFNDLYRTINSVSDTMNNMLAWASSQLNGLQIHPDRIDMEMLVDSLIELFRGSANAKDIEINHQRGDKVIAWADVNQLRTALRNIISNAIKFTKRGGSVTINYHTEGSQVIIKVSDTGIGIAPDYLPEVFNFNGRSRSVGTNNERGTGIGLMLSKEFINSNDGEIEVTSELGKGTVFKIRLPNAERVKQRLSVVTA